MLFHVRERLSAACLGAALATLLVGGCSPSNDAELLRVTSFTPDRWIEGTTVHVVGEGFPLGREGRVSLEGECRSPGEAPRRVTIERTVHALTAEEAVLEVDARLVRAAAGRATCRFGGLVRFEGATGGVVGRFGSVVLDLVPRGRDRIATRAADAERGRAVASRLGLAFADEDPDDGGLRVAGVSPSSVAARAGVAPGDVVLSVDGIRLLDVSDFVPTPGFRRTSFEVRREPSGRVDTIEAPTFVASQSSDARTVGYALLAFVAALIAAFFAPSARFVDFLATRSPRDDEATLAWLFGVTDDADSPRARRLSHALVALGVLGMGCAFAGVALVGRFLADDFGASILLSASLALRLASRVFGEPSEGEHAPYLPFFVASAPLSIVVAAVGLLVGTGHLGELNAAQGGLPTRWLVFANPIAFALFPVFAATALTRVEPEGATSAIARVAARAHLMVVSALGAALFLGGWSPPIAELAHAQALGTLGFVAKSFALLALGLWARGVTTRAATQAWKWTVPVAVLGLGAAFAWSYLGVSFAVERASGLVLSVVTGLVLAYVAVTRLRGPREPELVISPFL